MKIVTVLKSGGIYKPEHVKTLHQQCLKYGFGSEFICISDDPTVPGYYPMKHDWPTWWGKMEIFLIPGPVLYLDLDTIVIKDLTSLFKEIKNHKFICLRDFYKDAKMERSVGSGVMAWNGDMSFIYKEFLKDPEKNMAECTTPRWWGDQGFIEKCVSGQVYWQDIAPRKIVSWKVHCKHEIPGDAHIIAFHGKPKPWEEVVTKRFIKK